MDQPKPAIETPPVPAPATPPPAQEIGGAKRTTEPTRYQDWEINGKCVDF